MHCIVGADMVRHMEGSNRGAKGLGPRESTGVEDRGTSAGQGRELGRSKRLPQDEGGAQPAHREDVRRSLGSRMPSSARGRGVTPAEPRAGPWGRGLEGHADHTHACEAQNLEEAAAPRGVLTTRSDRWC